MKKDDIDFLSFLSGFVVEELGVDEDLYFDVIENKCTYHEGKFIVYACLSERKIRLKKPKNFLIQSLEWDDNIPNHRVHSLIPNRVGQNENKAVGEGNIYNAW